MEPNRRRFLLGGAFALPYAFGAEGKVPRAGGVRLKLGLNAYSFDRPLRAGEMTLEDLVVFAAQNNFDALDATGYYFPGYPKAPGDDAIRSLKKKAYVNGVVLSSTGVRNDFSLADAAIRKKEVQLVKDWIEVAAKLGVPVIRVFSGLKVPEGQTWDRVMEWMVPNFQECAAHVDVLGVTSGGGNFQGLSIGLCFCDEGFEGGPILARQRELVG